MQLYINAIQTTTNIPDCMTIQELQHKQLHKMNTYNISKNISEAGQSTEIKYHKTWEHTRNFEMTQQ